MVVLVVAALVSGLLPGLAVESIKALQQIERYGKLPGRRARQPRGSARSARWAQPPHRPDRQRPFLGRLHSGHRHGLTVHRSAPTDMAQPRVAVGPSRHRPASRMACSGKVGDYVAWLTVGVALFGIVLAMWTGPRPGPDSHPVGAYLAKEPGRFPGGCSVCRHGSGGTLLALHYPLHRAFLHTSCRSDSPSIHGSLTKCMRIEGGLGLRWGVGRPRIVVFNPETGMAQEGDAIRTATFEPPCFLLG